MMKSDRISARGLNPRTISNFKKYVENKYGKLHTVFGQELERAMLMYLEAQRKPTHTRKHEHTPKDSIPSSKTKAIRGHKGFEKVRDTYYANAGECETFQRPYAERLIKETMQVHDSRTIEKYCTELSIYFNL